VIAVADTSPICYLVLIGEVDLLPALFSEVVIPRAVATELSDPRAPAPVRNWWQEPPDWIGIAERGNEEPPEGLRRLHRGEREAILLAERLEADFVLLDEKAARRAARALGLPVMGLLGVLAAAANRDLVDVPRALDRLHRTNFRVSPALLGDLLKRFA